MLGQRAMVLSDRRRWSRGTHVPDLPTADLPAPSAPPCLPRGIVDDLPIFKSKSDLGAVIALFRKLSDREDRHLNGGFVEKAIAFGPRSVIACRDPLGH